MSMIAALIMGLVQGFTEFLPVSSSAHLVFTQHFLHLHLSDADTVSFDVLLHLGTLLAVLVFFREDVLALLRGLGQLMLRPRAAWRENAHSRLALMLILATIPAALAGKLLKPLFEKAFQNVPGTAALLLVTAVMLWLIARWRVGERTLETANWKDAALIGVLQAIAILPGVSRSGATITGGLLRGFDREAAPRFSFLLSIPIILGGGLLGVKDVLKHGITLAPAPLLIGFLAAAISGYAAVVLLLSMLRRGRLDRFAYYCLVVGIGMLLYWNFLVPRPDMQQVKGSAGIEALSYDREGALGQVPVGVRWRLQIPVHVGLVPLTSVNVQMDDNLLPAMTQHSLPLAGITILDLELVPLRLNNLHGDGETREIRVILRNKWGIENEERVRLFIVPASPSQQTA